ncbi:MAG: DUF4198 domain-containing protein [Vicinamibacterales bacterium]
MRHPLVGTVTRRVVLAVLVAVTTVVAATPLSAHDFWIEASSFVPIPGTVVAARLRVGEHLVGDPVPRNSALISRFDVDDGAARRPLVGRDGADPAGLFRVESRGLLIVGYESHPSLVELTGEKFDTYLKEEGLDDVARLRAGRHETGSVRERFSRCAKSLLLAGAPVSDARDRALGCPLELVVQDNPYVRRSGALTVQVTYRGRPVEGLQVVAMSRIDPAVTQSLRSGKDGRVRFDVARSGLWLIKAVHMVAAPVDSQADWESFWASVTFELPESNHATDVSSR